MYINQDQLDISEKEDPKGHLKNITISALKNMENTISSGRALTLYQSLDTLDYIGEYAEHLGIENSLHNNHNITTGNEVAKILQNFYIKELRKVKTRRFIHISAKYEFSNEEYKTIQEKINTLRSDIQDSKIFGDEHKERLLNKLEELQKNLHQKMESVDKSLGIISSIGVTLGKFGKDVKPLFDRFNETFKLIHKVEERGDNVPPLDNQVGYEGIVETELIEESSEVNKTDI